MLNLAAAPTSCTSSRARRRRPRRRTTPSRRVPSLCSASERSRRFRRCCCVSRRRTSAAAGLAPRGSRCNRRHLLHNKQDGVDFKSAQDAARLEGPNLPTPTRARSSSSTSPSRAAARQRRRQRAGSGGGSEGGSDDGSGQDPRGAGRSPATAAGGGGGVGRGRRERAGVGVRRIGRVRRRQGPEATHPEGAHATPRGGGGANKNKRAMISPEVDKIEPRFAEGFSRRGGTSEEGFTRRRRAASEGALAPRLPPRLPPATEEEGGARAAPRGVKPDVTRRSPTSQTRTAPTTEKPDPAPTEAPFAAIFSAMAHQTIIKEASGVKAFDEQSLHQQRAYALATRPWREEGAATTVRGDSAAPPSHHQRQHQAAAAVHHAQVPGGVSRVPPALAAVAAPPAAAARAEVLPRPVGRVVLAAVRSRRRRRAGSVRPGEHGPAAAEAVAGSRGFRVDQLAPNPGDWFHRDRSRRRGARR